MKPLLLLIDDDNEFIEDFCLLLENDFRCISANNGNEGIHILNSNSPDIILLDLMFQGEENGIEILKRIKNIDEDIPVLMITDYGSIETAIEAIKLGATDYISKTPNLKELKLIIDKSLNSRLEKLRNNSLRQQIENNFKEIIGDSKIMNLLKQQIQLYSQNKNTVLIFGESGVGKELVARKIHSLSPFKNEPFIAINCAALPKDLIESELFGHERGAFTGADRRKPGKFEIAQNGTIFLDEISELNLDVQVKLLRVLQEKEFERVGGNGLIKSNCRVIAATNKNLKKMVLNGSFREDLYYRLDVLPVEVPPLRERKDDIPLLIEHFINIYSTELNKKKIDIPDKLMKAFIEYDWPGNVRELQNYLTRLIIIPNEIDKIDFLTSGKSLLHNNLEKISIPTTWNEMDIMRREAADKASREIEKLFLKNLLSKFEGNISKAAEHIGINRTNLHKMIKKCGL